MIEVVHRLPDLSGWLPVRSNRQVMLSGICMEVTAKVRTCVSLMSDKGRFLLLTGTRSIASSVESCPSITLPKMVYFESRCGCLAYAMKN